MNIVDSSLIYTQDNHFEKLENVHYFERYTLNRVGKADAYKIIAGAHGGNANAAAGTLRKYGIYYIINNELVIALTKVTSEIAEEIINIHPQKVIALDRLFAGNDELKTNTALQMRDAGVEFRTV
ncbi:MAG: hypothetical protein LBH93_00375 [Chitinispirillales bacterium]|jgi:uncharacterized membrane protein YqiK|nr:hypothetical protein [Chitinispirillales bacterium]